MAAALDAPTLGRDGAQLFAGAANGALAPLRKRADSLAGDRAGLRLHGDPVVRALLADDGPVTTLATGQIGRPARPVRALHFDKTADTNWALGWHQNRTICVRERVEHAGFGPWTVKHGLHHVAPPQALLDRMVTLRLHLDDVPETNAPLLVALGSHRLGRIAEREVDDVVARCAVHVCTAEAGDIWAYRTPILHASGRASGTGHRRVLQVDFSSDELPGDLEWLGI